MTVYECHQYLVDNGYGVVEDSENGHTTTTFIKNFDGYDIHIYCEKNFCGGSERIDIYSTNTEPGRVKSYWRMTPPNISFYATGYHVYQAMEERAKEIVEKLNEWAIETL